jgi:uncharacterized protein YkwD
MIATTTMLLLINSVRPTQFPLKVDYQLQKLAEKRCISTTTFTHDDFWSTYSNLELGLGYRNAGENLALNFSKTEDIFKALENSPTHRKNNHSLYFQKVGIASCEQSFGNWFTVIEFAGN